MHLFCWESGENHTDHEEDTAQMRWCSASWNGELHPIMGKSKASSTRNPVGGRRVQFHAQCVVGAGHACVPQQLHTEAVLPPQMYRHTQVLGKHLKLKQFPMHLC